MWKHRVLAPDWGGTCQRNDFSELRFLHLLIFRKMLNFLTWDEKDKFKFYIAFCSFCLCNSACSLQSLDHIGLRKWGLTILETGAYLTFPCPALCNRPAPANPQTCLIMPVHVLKLYKSWLRAWSIKSSGPTSVTNLSSPNLQVWCFVSWVLVSATFLSDFL